MNNRVVILHNAGTANLVRLMVSVHSLRKHWRGDVAILLDGPQLPWVAPMLEKFWVQQIPFVSSAEGKFFFVKKPELWKFLPYPVSTKIMYVDSDTVITESPDEFFTFLDEAPFVCTQYSKWLVDRFLDQRWIGNFKRRTRMTFNAGQPCINGGVMGWTGKAVPILTEWSRRTKRIDADGYRGTDELALMSMLPDERIKVVDQCWNQSVRLRYPVERIWKTRKENLPKIVHFHGNRHFWSEDVPSIVPQHKFWLKELKQTKESLPEELSEKLDHAYGDIGYEAWLQTGQPLRGCKRIWFK